MTAVPGDTSTTMQSTKAEDTNPATQPPHTEKISGEAISGEQGKGKKKNNKKKNKGNKSAGHGQTVAAVTAKAEELGDTAQTRSGDVSIEPVGSGPKPAVELKSKEKNLEKEKEKEKEKENKGHTRGRSVTVEDVSESPTVFGEPTTPPAKEEIPVHKSTATHQGTGSTAKDAPESSTFAAASKQKDHNPPPSLETRATHIPPASSPSTTSSDSVPVTPTSPPATETHLEFSPAAILSHALHGEDRPKHVFPEPHIMSPIPSRIHPHNPERITTEDLVHTVTSHHHPPHHQAPHPQPNQLHTEPVRLQDAPIPPPGSPIPPPPKPKSPVPPIHAPGPGVTAGRLVMLANPPPPIGCIAPIVERQITECNIGHLHEGHVHPGHGFPVEMHSDIPYQARSLYASSTEIHPTGYAQNPRAAEWPGMAMRRSPYDSGLGGRNDEDDEGEGGGLFGRRTPPGATVNTKGYHRRGGEDVGLVASLVNLWEKSVDWFQEWMDATRH